MGAGGVGRRISDVSPWPFTLPLSPRARIGPLLLSHFQDSGRARLNSVLDPYWLCDWECCCCLSSAPTPVNSGIGNPCLALDTTSTPQTYIPAPGRPVLPQGTDVEEALGAWLRAPEINHIGCDLGASPTLTALPLPTCDKDEWNSSL